MVSLKYASLLTPSLLEDLVMTKGLSLSEVGRIYDVDHVTVAQYCRRFGIVYNTINTGRTVYRRIDLKKLSDVTDSNVAYYMGFAAADGSLSGNTLRFELHKKDRSVLEGFLSEFNLDNPISDSRSTCVTLQVTATGVPEALKAWGIWKRKSLNIRLPHLPRNSEAPFLRGLFDGDGCVTSAPRRPSEVRAVFFTTSSPGLAEDLQRVLEGQEVHTLVRKRNNGKHSVHPVYRVFIRYPSLIRFYNLLYSDVGPHLARKQIKFKSVLKGAIV